MDTAVIVVIGAFAILSWIVAAASWLLAVRNRAEGVSLSSMFLEGIRMFDSSSFTEVGQRHQQRFVLAFVCFLLAVMASAVAMFFFAP